MTNHTQYIFWVLATAVLGAQFQLQVPVYNHRAAGPHTLREFIRAGWYLQWTLSFQNRCGSKGRSLGDGGFSFVMGVPPQIIPVVMNDHDLVLKPCFFWNPLNPLVEETPYIYIVRGTFWEYLMLFLGGNPQSNPENLMESRSEQAGQSYSFSQIWQLETVYKYL
jgi:hypothetical protein